VVFWVYDIGVRGFPVHESGRLVLVRRDDAAGVILRVCSLTRPTRPMENTPFVAPPPTVVTAPAPVTEAP
jgi:hypothetical protein